MITITRRRSRNTSDPARSPTSRSTRPSAPVGPKSRSKAWTSSFRSPAVLGLVDVKGRRFPSGDEQKQYWKNWSTRDDLVSLARLGKAVRPAVWSHVRLRVQYCRRSGTVAARAAVRVSRRDLCLSRRSPERLRPLGTADLSAMGYVGDAGGTISPVGGAARLVPGHSRPNN